VEKPSFVVRLADLERASKKITFTLSEDWLRRALSDADAVPQGPGVATVELMKTGEMVVVRGEARVSVTVPCVVTLDPLPFELAPDIFLQLVREAEPPRPKPAKTDTKADATASAAPAAASESKKRPTKPRKNLKDEPELSAEEAAYDTFRGEEVVLDDFFREFILLELPAYPRRSDLPSPEESISSRPFADPDVEAKPLDPRLAPLLGLVNRIKGPAKLKD